MTRGTGVIDAELARFVHGPVSAFLGTADAFGVPDASRVAGLVPLGADRFRILISTCASAARANARPGVQAALLVTDITTYRSVQWKGRIVEAGAPRTSGDLAVVHHHVEAFMAASPLVGIDAALAWRIFPSDVVPLLVEVSEVFDQTPGPGAGRRIDPAT